MGDMGSGSTIKPREKFASEQTSHFVQKRTCFMKPPKDDRRSRRTRQLLGDALVELMLEKHFERITVQDILDRADVGRSTFYAHYTDKESLLISQIEHVIHELEAYTTEAGGKNHGLLPSLELFRHVKEQRRLMQAFVWGRGAEILTQDFQAQVSKIIEQNIRSMVVDTVAFSLPLSVVAKFVASTFVMLLRWWFDEEMQHTPEQMDEMFQKLVMPGIHELIG
jgi:AcrR family transcriptional regulator